MKCYSDQTREAVGVCSRCGKAICPEESIIINDKLYCKECAEKIKEEEAHPKTLHRSLHSRMLAGVCGGLGEYFGIDPTIVRIIFVLLLIVPKIGLLGILLLYILLWLIMPEGD